YTIRKVDTRLIITAIAGNNRYRAVADGTLAANAFLQDPEGLAFDRSGNLFIADSGLSHVRKVDGSGTFTTIAGSGVSGLPADKAPAIQSLIGQPVSLAVDAQNNIYFADIQNHRIARVGTDGILTTVAGSGTFRTGGSFSGDNGQAASAGLNTPRGL